MQLYFGHGHDPGSGTGDFSSAWMRLGLDDNGDSMEDNIAILALSMLIPILKTITKWLVSQLFNE